MIFLSACAEGWRRVSFRRVSCLAGWLLATLASVGPALATPMVYEVSINGVATGRIEEFDDRDGQLFAAPEALERLGIRVEGEFRRTAVPLSAIPQLRYAIDKRRQALDLRIAPSLLAPRTVDFTQRGAGRRPTAGYGGVLNYEVYADSTWIEGGGKRSDTLSVFLNPRLFSPYGVLSSSLIASPTTKLGDSHFRRLETSWSYGDYDDMVRYRAGDLVTSGLSWSRPVYMGGVQAITDFAMRPDLLITPVPLITGVAAAPSTVDVLVNGVRRASQNVDQGPFNITNLPVITGRGEVSVVVRDALGRETVQNFPYYVAASMLREDLYAFGVETGFLRKGYVGSDIDYGDPAAAATFRYGATNWATVEAHVEAAAKVQNGGLGAIVALGDIGQFKFAAAASLAEGGAAGYQFYAAFERNIWSRSSNFFVSAQHSSARYADVATLIGARPVRHQYRAGVSFAPLGMGESIGLSATELKPSGSDRFRLVSASAGVPVARGVNATLSGYRSLEPDRWAAMLTFNVQLGNRTTAFLTAGAERDRDAYGTADVFSYPAQQDGGFGWRVGGSLDGQRNGRAAADVTYLAPVAALQAGAARSGSVSGVRASASGAIALLDGVHFARDIYDGFAVVDAGGPDVGVLRGNVPVGRTGPDGRLLVRNLISYYPNKIGLDPNSLPADIDVDHVDITVTPMDRSGVAVNFPARKASASLLAKIILPDGSLAPLGSTLMALNGGVSVTVGYDGLAYFKDLSEAATYELRDASRTCRVMVPAAAQSEARLPTKELACR